MSDRYGKSLGQRIEADAAARRETHDKEYQGSSEGTTSGREPHPWAPSAEGVTRVPYMAAEGRVLGFKDTGRNYTFLFNDSTYSGDVHASNFQIPLSDARPFADAPEQVRQALLVGMVQEAERRRNQPRPR